MSDVTKVSEQKYDLTREKIVMLVAETSISCRAQQAPFDHDAADPGELQAYESMIAEKQIEALEQAGLIEFITE